MCGQHRSALLRFTHARLQALDAPFETVIFGMAGKDGFDAAGFHEIVEVFDGIPAAGIDADARDAQFVGDIEAFESVIDFFLTIGGVGLDEILVNGQADERDTVPEGMSF